MKCHFCNGPLGLIRHKHLTMTGYLHFCSKRCVEDYRQNVRLEVGRRKLLSPLDGLRIAERKRDADSHDERRPRLKDEARKAGS